MINAMPPLPPSPPLLSLPTHDSQDPQPTSQQPLCTPVDQFITRTEHASMNPPSPVRTAVKRRRINPRKAQPHAPRSGKAKPAVPSRRAAASADAVLINSVGYPLLSDSMDAMSMDMIQSSSQQHAIPSLADDESIPQSSQPCSQRDLPQFSQDTLALLPTIVREHQLARFSRPKSAPAPAVPSDMPPASARTRPPNASADGLLRASLISALTSAPPMLNPYLAHVDQQQEVAMRPANASDSFQNLDMILQPQNGSKPGQNADAPIPHVMLPPPAVRSAATFDRATPHPNFNPHANSLRRKSLKLLLVSSAQRPAKSADFDMREVAGRGAFSEVWRAVHRIDGCEYAIKKNRTALNSDHARIHSLHEVFSLAALQGHPNILRYFDAWFEDHGKFLFMQTEFLPQGNLHTRYVDKHIAMPLPELLALTHDLAAALEYMHSRDVAHIDVKPDNIFSIDRGLERSSYIIGDFGLACQRYGYGARNTEGDSRYLCPEALSSDDEVAASVDSGLFSGGMGSIVNPGTHRAAAAFKRPEPNKNPGRQTCRDLCAGDVFSLGATLYELCIGSPLEKSGPQWKRLRTCPNDAAQEVKEKCNSDFFAEIVRKCLEPDPCQRLSAADVKNMCASLTAADASAEKERVQSEIAGLRTQLSDAQARITRFESVISALLAKGEEGRQHYRNRHARKFTTRRRTERIVGN